MKIISVKNLVFPEVKVVRFGRFPDNRGYFTEPWRRSDFKGLPELDFFKTVDFVQSNESYSRPGTIRGLHFQWNPYVGKLVRTVFGHMVDMLVDIRKNSPTFGKGLMYDMPQNLKNDFFEWIWVPPGFAHGNFYPQESLIEYFCSGQYNPACEAGLSPLAKDINWSLADAALHQDFIELASGGKFLMSDKDKGGFTAGAWAADKRSENFSL